MILANVISENFPMGVVMGLIALRTRSIALPSILHISFDTMGDLVGL
ncbi:MAG: CPBP family glutamic-type intramembrane protease [Vulcanimicrobiaceae bacterium]